MLQLRPHQIQKSTELAEVLKRFNIGYLAGQVRSGKTLTALNTCELLDLQNVLIVTKKKAIPSILSDHEKAEFSFKLDAINYESLHKLEHTNYDLVIYDEAHSLGAYPKPSKRTKLAKKLFFDKPVILMSGTPAVESFSQLYHQFYVSKFSPFKQYKNFYKFANDLVDKKELRLPTHTVTDYSGAKTNEINEIIKPYIVKMTQQDAGFDVVVNEQLLYCDMPDQIKNLTKQLSKDKAIEGKSGYILGDTPAKLQSKLHQLYNGHCIIETASGETKDIILSRYKAEYILKRFKQSKIVIMYYYQNELKILQRVFGDAITTDVDVFNNSDKNIAVQQSSTEGQNLSKADAIVYMNLGFSGKNYLQSRDRLTVKERKENNVYFIVERNGITSQILKAVRNKRDFNKQAFQRWQASYNQN